MIFFVSGIFYRPTDLSLENRFYLVFRIKKNPITFENKFIKLPLIPENNQYEPEKKNLILIQTLFSINLSNDSKAQPATR